MLEIFNAIHDWVVVQPDTKVSKTDSGILLPDTHIKPSVSGVVIAVGNGTWHGNQFIETIVKKGDKVCFSVHVDTKIVINNKQFLVMKESDIFGIYTGDTSVTIPDFEEVRTGNLVKDTLGEEEYNRPKEYTLTERQNMEMPDLG